MDDPRALKQAHLEEKIAPFIPQGTELVKPPCPYFDVCGGCQLQHIPYPAQLKWKRQHLLHLLAEQGIEADELTDETRGLVDSPYLYRNKADFSARTWDNELHLGYRPHGGRGELVEIDECPIVLPAVNKALAAVRQKLHLVPSLARKLVSLVVRCSLSTGKSALLYHSKLKDETVYETLTKNAASIDENLAGGTFVKKRKEYIYGEGELTEAVGNINLTYSVRSFFQANPRLLPQLCEAVKELAEPCKKGVMMDVFCGVGLFALYLSNDFEQLYGIESAPCSVKMAQRNAQNNGVTSVQFVRDIAEERFKQFMDTGVEPGLVVLDPPRSGLGKSVVASLNSLNPSPVVVLVSCNPHSLAIDLAGLLKGGYKLERIIPVDMFPQTEHLEVVARLTR